MMHLIDFVAAGLLDPKSTTLTRRRLVRFKWVYLTSNALNADGFPLKDTPDGWHLAFRSWTKLITPLEHKFGD